MYRADGLKLKKLYRGNKTEYLDGFQYEDDVLQFVPTAGGYYDFNLKNYIYNFTDHLGNVRLSYRAADGGGFEILEENNYYPFGLKFVNENLGTKATPSYNYKYNGKELQETGMYDYGWRNYAPDLGRWITPDPLLQDLDFEFNPNDVDDEDDDEIEEATERALGVGGGVFNPDNLNPYSYGYNDPVRFDDPDGKCPICVLVVLAVAISEPMKNGTRNPQADRQAFKQAESFRNAQIAMVATGGGGSPKNGASVILNIAKSKAQNEVRKAAMQRGVQNEAKTIAKEGLTKNNKTFTVTDPKTGKPVSTKPDAIDSKKITEIKDVKKLYNTKQIRAQRELAKQQGKKYEVLTGKETKVSKTFHQGEVKKRKYLGPQSQ